MDLPQGYTSRPPTPEDAVAVAGLMAACLRADGGAEGPADGGANPDGHAGGADGGAEGPADGGANPGGHDGGADGTAS